MELVKEKSTKKIFPDKEQIGSRISAAALKRGLKIFGYKGHDTGMISDFLLLAPPLTIDKEELDFMANTIDSSIQEIENTL